MFVRTVSVLLIAVGFVSCGSAELPSGDHLVDLGTHSLAIHKEGEGHPAVFIDGGIASSSEEWRPIQQHLSEYTSVYTYDRAGYGASEPGPLPRDCGTAADELNALIGKLGIAGPCVFVGHSLGALNLQVYASRYPDNVAGLVLLDPPPLAWLLGERFAELHEMAIGMTNEWQAIADQGRESSDPEAIARAEFFRTIASEHREMLGTSAELAAKIETFGDIPLVVIAAGVPNPMFGTIAQEYQEFWIEQSRAVSEKSSRGQFLLAPESTHHLHRDAPSVVQDAITKLLSTRGDQ